MATDSVIEKALERKALAERRMEELKAEMDRMKKEVADVDTFLAMAETLDLLDGAAKKPPGKAVGEPATPPTATTTRVRVKKGAWAEKIVNLILARGPLTMTELRAALEEDRKKAKVSAFRETLARAIDKRPNLFRKLEDGKIDLVTRDIELVD